MHASFHGYFKIVKILLENKALVDMEDKVSLS